MTTPLPHGPVLINGVYCQPVPAPHNVVVAQSAVPAPTTVPCAEEAKAPAEPALIKTATGKAPAESSPVKLPTVWNLRCQKSHPPSSLYKA